MTLLIYCVVVDNTDWLKSYKRVLMGLSVTIPSIIIFPATIYHGNGPCFQGDIAFNCACPNYQQPYWHYVVNWMLPCVLLTIFIIILIVLIEKLRCREGEYLRDEQRLALGAYYVPVTNFIFLFFNIILDSVENISVGEVV